MKSFSMRIFNLFAVIMLVAGLASALNAQDKTDKTKPAGNPDDQAAEEDEGYSDEGRTVGMDYKEDEGVVVLDREEILKVINVKTTSIRSCYETALQTNQSLQGKLMVNFFIELDGSVSGAKIVEDKSTMKEKKVNECVMEIVKNMRFAPRKKGEPMEINFPFNFQPKK